MEWEMVLQLLGVLMMFVSAAGGATGLIQLVKGWLNLNGVPAQILAFVIQGLVASWVHIKFTQFINDKGELPTTKVCGLLVSQPYGGGSTWARSEPK